MAEPARTAAPVTGAFLFFGVFSLYLITAAPTVTFWDSGELATAAYVLGIPHSPGYPLFCLAGRLFGFMPLGNAAFRLNLLSAFFASLAVLTVYATLVELMRQDRDEHGAGRPAAGTLIPAALALMLGLSRVFWSQAVVTEVYALNAFFVSALLYAHVLSARGRLSPERYVALSGFMFGLAAVNHVSAVLYAPALALSWAYAAREPRARAWLTGAFFIVAGLSVYIYLPLRSASGTGLNLGHPDTWSALLSSTGWGGYPRSAVWLLRSAEGLLDMVDLSDWRFAAGLPVAAAASWLLVRENPRLYLPPLVFVFFFLAVVSAQVLGSPRDIRFGLPPKFFIPALVTAAVLAGGLARPLARAAVGGYAPTTRRAAAGALLFTAVLAGYSNYSPNDMSGNYIAFDYAENSLKSAGERGVLLTWGDNGVFPLWYLRTVERFRDDAVLVHAPLMTYDWYLADVADWMGGGVKFMPGYFLGENAYRLLKEAGPERTLAYDYSAARFLELDENKLTRRGLVYFEGPVPGGDPWPHYVFRGVAGRAAFKGPMEENIIAIYKYMARLSASPAAALLERP